MLRAAEVRAFQPREKVYRKSDEKGLYVEISPNGSKLWRLKYRFAGIEKRLALGAFPEVSLADARRARDEARSMIADGIDPSLQRKRDKAVAKVNAANTFEAVALEYLDKMEREGKAEATLNKARWFLKLLKPAIGRMPINDVEPQMLLAALKKQEARGTLETAKKCRSFSSRVFRYGAATGRCKSDPAAILQGVLVAPKARNYAAILEPDKFGEMLRAIDGYVGSPTTMYALRILPHVYTRPGEMRHAEWGEFDFQKAIWNVPPGRMKARRGHSVPLSTQVVGLFAEYRELTGGSGYVFPSVRTRQRPMSENTLNAALRRLGYSTEEATSHGFRSTASSFLNESGKWNPDAIERSLAHGDSDATRSAYHRASYWQERVRMAQWWSDYIDLLRGR